MQKHRIELAVQAARDPKAETKHYCIPDPDAYDAFYAHTESDELRTSTDQGALKEFMSRKIPLINKSIALERGGAKVVIEVSDRYFAYIKNDRNLFLRDLGIVETTEEKAAPAPDAHVIEASTAKAKRSRKTA